MKRIRYQSVKDDIKDRLNQLVIQGNLSESIRTALTNDRRLAIAVTEAVLRFAKMANPSSLDELLYPFYPGDTTITPREDLKITTKRNVTYYPFPDAAFAEREDSGILNIEVNRENLSFAHNDSLETVIFKANNIMYGTCESCFNIDYDRRIISVPCGSLLGLDVIAKPHNIRTTDLRPGAWSFLITGAPTVASSIDMDDTTLGSARNISIPIDAGATVEQAAEAIRVYLEGRTPAFFYLEGFTTDTPGEIILQPRAGAPTNLTLDPVVTVGSGDITIGATTPVETYALQLNPIYQDEIVNDSMMFLLGGNTKRPVSKSQSETMEP